MATYFFGVTVSTVGYGDILPKTPLEVILVLLTIITSLISLVKLIEVLKRKKVTKLPKKVQVLLLASEPERIEKFLEALSWKYEVYILLSRETDEEELEYLKDKHRFFVVTNKDLYSSDLFDNVEKIDTAVIMTKETLNNVDNNNRAIGSVQIIESLYPECRTIAEYTGDLERVSLFSSGDTFVPKINASILGQEVIKEGAYNKLQQSLEEIKEGIR
jgi:hypothetical protein